MLWHTVAALAAVFAAKALLYWRLDWLALGPTLQRLGGAFLERGGMDCGAGSVAALDEGLAACRAALCGPQSVAIDRQSPQFGDIAVLQSGCDGA